MNEVEIANNQSALSIDEGWYHELAVFVLESESITESTLSIAFVDNSTIHQLNNKFLQHDYPTDVITFPLSGASEKLAGEVVVSAEFAIEQAAEYDMQPAVEVGLYIVHGLLHLCGYDDRDPHEAAEMKTRQQQLLDTFLEQNDTLTQGTK